MPDGQPTHSTRWRRRPARGTAWRSDARPGGFSRTRILGRDRAGLPSEPGRGFFQDVALLAQRLHLTPEAAQLLALLGGQTVLAAAVVAIGLGDPVADRLAVGSNFSASSSGARPARTSSTSRRLNSGG